MTGQRYSPRALFVPGGVEGKYVLDVDADGLVTGTRRLIAGTDITLDDSVDGVLSIISTAVAGGGGGGGGPWTAYTPTWTSDGTAPSAGNAVIAAAYEQVGKTVHFRLDLTFGSTTTFGTGSYRFGLPVAAKSLTRNHGILVAGYLEKSLVTAYGLIGARMTNGDTSSFELLYSTGSAGTALLVGRSAPVSWAANDFIRVYGSYEAA